jgi:hypothetical protein
MIESNQGMLDLEQISLYTIDCEARGQMKSRKILLIWLDF